MKLCRISGVAIFAAAGILLPMHAAQAGRTIQIDIASKQNTLGSCGSAAFSNCTYLNRAFGASVVGVNISQNGYIQLLDGRAGSANLFFAGKSDTLYTVFSGYTDTTSGRIDLINFYQPNRDLTPNGAGNRPDPDFQIQLHNITGRNGLTDLEVAYAYSDRATPVAPGATIGYSGATFSQTGSSIISSQRAPAERSVTNSGGLLLGTQPTDSDFSFVVGDYLLVQNQMAQGVTMGLVSETFAPRYAAATALPEPATWGMMVTGFGLAGGTLRRRRRNRRGEAASIG